jgi:hypothetical protein
LQKPGDVLAVETLRGQENDTPFLKEISAQEDAVVPRRVDRRPAGGDNFVEKFGAFGFEFNGTLSGAETNASERTGGARITITLI